MAGVRVSIEKAAERCINVLLELIQTKVNYVVQEAIIVIKDIFRRYPNRCGPQPCHLNPLTQDPQGKDCCAQQRASDRDRFRQQQHEESSDYSGPDALLSKGCCCKGLQDQLRLEAIQAFPCGSS